MKSKWEFSKKYTTFAIYVCGIIAFAIIFNKFITNNNTSASFFNTLKSIFNPILIGLAIAYLLNPIMNIFENRVFRFVSKKKPRPKLQRGLGILCSYFLLLSFLTAFLWILIPQFVDSLTDLVASSRSLINNAIISLENFSSKNATLNDLYNTYIKDIDLIKKLEEFGASVNVIAKKAADIALQAWTVMQNTVLGLFLSIYFLASKEMLMSQVRRFSLALFSFKTNTNMKHLVDVVDNKFGQFIRGKIIDSLIVAIIVYIASWIAQIPYFPMIAIIIGVTDLIPVFGPFLGAIPSTLIILISQDGGLKKAIIFVVIILVVQQLDGNVIAPKILGDKVGMSGIWIMLAILIMGALFGVLGMFIGVPVFAVIYTLIGEFIHKRLIKKGLAKPDPQQNEHDDDNKKGMFSFLFKKKRKKAKVVAGGNTGDDSETIQSSDSHDDFDIK